MKNSSAKIELRTALLQLLRMDYGVELYNWNENICRLSFYKLSSVYNAFCESHVFDDNWTAPAVSWQYATRNNRAERLAVRAVNAAVQLYRKTGSWDAVETEFKYFEPLSKSVYDAKYSIQRDLYAAGMGAHA